VSPVRIKSLTNLKAQSKLVCLKWPGKKASLGLGLVKKVMLPLVKELKDEWKFI